MSAIEASGAYSVTLRIASGLYVLDFGVLGVGAFEYSERPFGVPARVDGVYGDLVKFVSSSWCGVVDILSVSMEVRSKAGHSILSLGTGP